MAYKNVHVQTVHVHGMYNIYMYMYVNVNKETILYM